MSEEEKEELYYFCFGEYGKFEKCEMCKLREQCKEVTTDLQEGLYYRYKGKYKGRGKRRKRDKI